MKKQFLVFVALMVSVFAFASNGAKLDEVKVNSAKEVKASSELATVRLDKNAISLPLTISVPAPSETVVGISGPVRPNNTNWNVSNGYLTITYMREYEIFDLYEGGTFYIEVATSPMMYYVIKLIVD